MFLFSIRFERSFESGDYIKTQEIQKLDSPIEIFIDYKDHITTRGLSNYKRGCHGSYFVHILSSATTLLGTNYYSENINEVPIRKAKDDLLDRTEEYFYRIQKVVLNSKESDIDNEKIFKYFGRIVSDLMLYCDEIKFSDMHKYHHTDIIEFELNNTKIFSSENVSKIQKILLSNKPTLSEICSIIEILYSSYKEITKNKK